MTSAIKALIEQLPNDIKGFALIIFVLVTAAGWFLVSRIKQLEGQKKDWKDKYEGLYESSKDKYEELYRDFNALKQEKEKIEKGELVQKFSDSVDKIEELVITKGELLKQKQDLQNLVNKYQEQLKEKSKELDLFVQVSSGNDVSKLVLSQKQIIEEHIKDIETIVEELKQATEQTQCHIEVAEWLRENSQRISEQLSQVVLRDNREKVAPFAADIEKYFEFIYHSLISGDTEILDEWGIKYNIEKSFSNLAIPEIIFYIEAFTLLRDKLVNQEYSPPLSKQATKSLIFYLEHLISELSL